MRVFVSCSAQFQTRHSASGADADDCADAVADADANVDISSYFVKLNSSYPGRLKRSLLCSRRRSHDASNRHGSQNRPCLRPARRSVNACAQLTVALSLFFMLACFTHFSSASCASYDAMLGMQRIRPFSSRTSGFCH